ncbi:MAG: hypothetical protein JST36_07555 [Bacteroidetes bacterium]|nr:hypothetical protein [Bacteroidota bacterium]
MKKTVLLLVIALLTVGSLAAHTTFIKSTNKKFPRVKEKTVLYGMQKPDSAVEVGVVIVNTRSERAAITDARKWAARNGANYLVMKTAKDMSTGASVANKLLWTGIRGKYILIAYRVESELVP